MVDERITKAQRWLDLIACLLGRRRPMTVEQIFEAVPAYRIDSGPEGDPKAESVRRKFERDKDELRELGIPIDTESFAVGYGTESVEGYRLRPAALYLPILRIVEATGERTGASSPRREPNGHLFAREELEVVLAALRDAALIPGSPLAEESRSAYRKLTFDLDAVPEGAPVAWVSHPGAPELGITLGLLSDALFRRKRVTFRYHGLGREAATERDVAPYGLLMDRGAWYVVGHDALREAVRMFHAGRIEDPRVNPKSPATPDYEIPDDFALGDHRGHDAWELGEEGAESEVRVRFAYPISLWVERNGHGEAEPEEGSGEGGPAVRLFRVRNVRPFLGWLLGFGGRARILEPDDLADELRRLASGIEDAHG